MRKLWKDIDKTNPNYKGNKFICKNCGIAFVGYDSRSANLYCSWKCKVANKNVVSTCETCGKVFKHYISQKRKYCSRGCMGQGIIKRMSGSNNPNWKGKVKRTHHQHSRKVLQQHLGRKLKSTEIVHHLDGDETNYALDNLYIFNSRTEHMAYHRLLRNCVIGCLQERIIQLK